MKKITIKADEATTIISLNSLKSMLLVFLFVFGIANSFGQTFNTLAEDNANNYGTAWAGNGGSGFGTWVFQGIGDGGFAGGFLEQNANVSSPSISTSNKSFGTFANGGVFPRITAFRSFNENLKPGDSFTVEIQHGGIVNGGSVGFTLRNGNVSTSADNYNTDSRFEIAFVGGDSNYSIFANSTTNTGVPFTFDGIRIKITLIDFNTVDVDITNLGSNATTTISNVILGGTADAEIQSLALFNRNARDANAYFNSLKTERPSYSTATDGDFNNSATWTTGTIPDGKGIININHNVNLDIDLSLSGELNISNPNEFIINSDIVLTNDGEITNSGSIVFNSNSSSSAQYGTSSGSLTGDVTVERYIPAGLPDLRRAFRFLTSSINSTGSINANWQQSGLNPGDIGYEANVGTHITGGTISDGFDQNETGTASMFTFDNTNQNTTASQDDDWYALPNTITKTLKAGEAYLTFIRGDRSIDVTSNTATPTNTSLRASGFLHLGPREFSSANNASTPEYGLSNQADFYSLVGNPYQAIVDINNLDFTNVKSNFYWVWDPNLGSQGQYTTVSLPSGLNNTTSPANQFIQPGQSFFVQTIADGLASLTFNEDDKNTSGGATTIFSDQNEPSIHLLLYTTDAFNTGAKESDGTLINFNENANNGLDLFDADKFLGPGENLARLHSNELISIENRAIPTDNEILALSTTGYTEDSYTFVVNASNIQNNFEAYLLDNYLGTQTYLSEGATQISFTVDANIPGSIAENRFSLIFDNTTLSVDDNNFGANFSLYPNPTSNGLFSIKTPNLSGEVSVEISNLLGQQVSIQELTVEGQQVDVIAQNLSTGLYVVKLSQGNQSFSSKLIVE